MLLNQLSGNTQATKTPRLLTREVDPKQQAIWTLQHFTERFSQWVFEVYDQMEHPALFQSPREAFDQGMAKAGARLHRLIAYSEEFLMQTRPTTHTGRAKISASRGITVNGLRYWNPAFAHPDVAGSQVEVRYEPYDMGVVYVFVRGQWLECLADNYAQVHGRSEREWHLLLEEWRAHQRQHDKKRVSVNGLLQAHFLEELEADEHVFLQQQRDHEERFAREALLGRKREALARIESRPNAHPHETPPFELDLSLIPRFEEYS
jgi:putative transposase